VICKSPAFGSGAGLFFYKHRIEVLKHFEDDKGRSTERLVVLGIAVISQYPACQAGKQGLSIATMMSRQVLL
jgi:hypothetical protein